jgi:hypothetical protein
MLLPRTVTPSSTAAEVGATLLLIVTVRRICPICRKFLGTAPLPVHREVVHEILYLERQGRCEQAACHGGLPAHRARSSRRCGVRLEMTSPRGLGWREPRPTVRYLPLPHLTPPSAAEMCPLGILVLPRNGGARLRAPVLPLRRVCARQRCRTVTRQTRRGLLYAAVPSIATRGWRISRRRRGRRMPSPLERSQGVGDTRPFQARPGAGTSATCQPGERAAGQILHVHPAHAPRPGR